MAKLQVRIFTAEKIKFDEPADMIIVRCVHEDMGKQSAVGDIGILPGHMTMSVLLSISPMRIKNEGTDRVLAIHGGIMTVKDNTVTLYTELAQWPEEIDAQKAKQEQESTQAALQAAADDTELRAASIGMRRALVQLEVSSYPLLRR